MREREREKERERFWKGEGGQVWGKRVVTYHYFERLWGERERERGKIKKQNNVSELVQIVQSSGSFIQTPSSGKKAELFATHLGISTQGISSLGLFWSTSLLTPLVF